MKFKFINCWQRSYGTWCFVVLNFWYCPSVPEDDIRATLPSMFGITVLNFGFEFHWWPK